MKNKRFLALSSAIILIVTLTLSGNVRAIQNSEAIRSEPPAILLSDAEYARPTGGWDVQAFLETQPGPLKEYAETSEGHVVPASRAIEFYGELWGINPRLLLALLELKSGLLSDATADVDTIRCAMGNNDPAIGSFLAQLRWAAEELSKGFFARYRGHNREQILLADGTIVEPAPGVNAGTFAVQRFLALGASRTQWETWMSDGQGGFRATYVGLFGRPETKSPASPAAVAGAPNLRLPWAMGETWHYTGGPHTATAGGVDYSKGAVDFAPGGGTGCYRSNAWVRAANEGTVVYAQCNLVRIDHGGNWSTAYFHLRDIQVSEGQHVPAGATLGHPSCKYGQVCGWSTPILPSGSHVHFETRLGNIPQKIGGTVLGGWTIREGASDYAGTMVKGDVVKHAHSGGDERNAILASPVSDISLDFTAELKYINSNPPGHGAEVELAVTKVGKHDALFSQIVTTDGDGRYTGLSLTGITPGRYDLYAKPSGYLRRKAGNVYLQEGDNEVDFSAGGSDPFLPGDVDTYGQDNKVNMLDYAVLRKQFGGVGSTDFNRDGVINTVDYSIFMDSYAEEGDGWVGRGPFSTMNTTTALVGPQSAAGSITLSPDSGVFAVGDTFDMQVSLDTGYHDSDGTNVIILYDPGVLEVQDADPSADGVQVTTGDVYDSYAQNKAYPSRGEINVAPMSDVGEVFQGSGTLATITFEVVASIGNTRVEVYFQDGQSADSNIAENATTVDVLGQAGTAAFQTTGSPERSMPTISFTPASNSVLQSSLVELEADVADPYAQVKEVEFEVYQDGAWTTIGSDTYSPDGWGLVWDASAMPHGNITLRATALLLGDEGTTVTNSNIMLDKEAPTYTSSDFTPPMAPSVGTPVNIDVAAADQGSGVDYIDVYAYPISDQGEVYDHLGTISGSEGSLTWDTSDCLTGTYQVEFVIWDEAGNWGPLTQPSVLFRMGLRNSVYLPLVARDS